MKILIILALLCSTHVMAKGKSGKSKSMRHLDITPSLNEEEPALTVDLDANIYGSNADEHGNINNIGNTIYFNPTLSYAYKDWDFSFQSMSIPIKGGGAQNFEYDNYFGIMHTMTLHPNIKWINGTVLGMVYNPFANADNPNPSTAYLHSFIFSDLNYVNGKFLIHGGPYRVNENLSTTTTYIGFQYGIAYTYSKVRVQADYVNGHSNVSGATVSTTFLIHRSFDFRTGVLVPESNSGNEFAGDVALIFHLF